MLLTDQQLDYISLKIKEKGLSNQLLQEEMLDHFACLVETKMEQGTPFLIATKQVFDDMAVQFMPELEKEMVNVLNNKSLRMKKGGVLLAACIIFLLMGLSVTTYFGATNEKEYLDSYVSTETNTKKNNNINLKQKDFKYLSNPSPVFVHHMDPPSRSPLNEKHKITSGFGMRMHPIFKKKKMHRGIDISAEKGTPVYATADGVVEKAITHNKYGRMVVVRHDDTYESLYAQLSSFEVKTGDEIKKGDLIGRVGSSGLSTAPHLHYEVLKNGEPVNPEKYF